MVHHAANGIDATNAGTSLHALGIQAGLLRRTVTVEHALRSATDVWVSEVTLAADAGQTAVLTLALRIGTTAELGAAWLWWWLHHRLRGALFVGISEKTRGASTDGIVFVHIADGISSTRSGTRILTALA